MQWVSSWNMRGGSDLTGLRWCRGPRGRGQEGEAALRRFQPFLARIGFLSFEALPWVKSNMLLCPVLLDSGAKEGSIGAAGGSTPCTTPVPAITDWQWTKPS